MITYLNLGKNGRFGNQLFQIAATIGIAVKNGLDYGFPDWINYDHADKFNSREDVNVQEYFKHPLPKLLKAFYKQVTIPFSFKDIKITDWVSLNGYMQTEKYFSHCANLIRHYFELYELSDRIIEPDAIALHIRLGDYEPKYNPRLDMEYYGKALELFDPKQKVYVFSDQPEEASKVINIKNVEFVEGNHYMEDFYLMTKFRNFIIANSSYSWWPAWLCADPGKKVIAPSVWFGPAYNGVISAKDIYCKDWIVI